MKNFNQRPRLSRLDANETAFLELELTDIDQAAYEELTPGLLARTYIPDLQPQPAQWADVYAYDTWKLIGSMKVSSPNSDDGPRSTATKTRTSRPVKQFDGSYAWTVREIQQAAATGVPLDRMTVMAARMAADQAIDNMLAFGDSDLGIEGLYTLSDVTTPVAPTAGVWSDNTPDQILADIAKLLGSVRTALRQTKAPGFQKFVLLLPTLQYTQVATTPRASNSDTTILDFAVSKFPWLESIEEWDAGNGAGAAVPGTTDRAVIYPRNPLCLGAVVPNDFSQLPPQERNQEIVVPTAASCGGVAARYPVAIQYLDGI